MVCTTSRVSGSIDIGPRGLSHLSPLAAAISESPSRSEEHTSELQSPMYPVCRLLLENKKNATVTADNRLFAFPYTKPMNANLNTDHSPAAIVFSLEAACAGTCPQDMSVLASARSDVY